ncbi:MAG: hypothetical protein ACRDGI_09540 [Candidatus Limnocylindrales bacterium]
MTRERILDADRESLAREAKLYRAAHRGEDRAALRRAAARLALTAARAAVRLARLLDECAVREGPGVQSGASPLG